MKTKTVERPPGPGDEQLDSHQLIHPPLNPSYIHLTREPAPPPWLAGGWFDHCTVTGAGEAGDIGYTFIRLTDPNGEFEDRWFFAHPDHKREMLETALAAMTKPLKVSVLLESLTEYRRIERLYVMIY